MADEIIIKIGTDADLTGAETVDDLIEEIRSNAEVEISVDVDDTSVQDATDTATELEDELDNIDSTVVSPEVDTTSLEEATSTAQETASSMDNITTAAAGIAATAGIEQMITTADNINTSWNRLELTFKGTGVSMDTLQNKASALSESTGRSGGAIRDYFNQMGIAGITNTDLLSSSFEALSGKAYQTGNSIETMESKMQMMVMSGNASTRMLRQLGLDAEDLAQAMGVSADQVSEAFKNMTPEERIQAITKAMGDGTEANEMYKDSYAGLKDRANAAMAGLMGAVGQAILPVVIPALEAATSFVKLLTDGFKALPGPVQGVIGGFLGMVAITTAVVGVLGVIGQVVSGVRAGLAALNIVTYAKAAADAVATAAQWLLNAAMDANPIGILIIALAALTAAVIWAYYNVDWFRAMVDNAWASLVQFGQYIYSLIAPAIQWLANLFQQFTSQLGLNTNDWLQAILGFILFIPTLPLQVGIALANALAKALGFGNNFVQGLISAASNAVSGFANYIRQIPQIVMDEFNRVLGMVNDFINSLPSRVWDMGAAIIDALKSSLGIGSPGHMFYMMEGELKRIENLPESMEGDITRNVSLLGSGIVDSFNPDLGTINGNVASGSIGGTVVNINMTDFVVDNEDRVEELCNAIAKRLHWDNVTAGRTI